MARSLPLLGMLRSPILLKTPGSPFPLAFFHQEPWNSFSKVSITFPARKQILKPKSRVQAQKTMYFVLPTGIFTTVICKTSGSSFVNVKSNSFRPVKGTNDYSQAIGTAPFIPVF